MLAYPLGIKVLPAQMPKRGHESIVEIRLGRSCLKEPLTIQFLGCANLRVAMDFDVLARNLDPNTSGSRARTDVEQIRELMRAQEVDWDVGYGALSNSPLWSKGDFLRSGALRFEGMCEVPGEISCEDKRAGLSLSVQKDVRLNQADVRTSTF